MKKRKGSLLLFTAFVAIVFMLAGCGSNSNADSGASGKKVVDFMHLWPQGSSAQHYKIVEEIVADYEEQNEDVEVNLEVLSNEQYKDKIKVLSSSNELPDVGMTWAAGYLEPYVKGEKFSSLNDILEDGLKDEFVSGTTEAFEVDGEVYGLPLELNIVHVYYNKAIFDEYNLEVPETLDELEGVINELNKNNVTPIALGNKDRWTGSMWYMYLADRIGGGELLTKAIEGDESFVNSSLKEAAQTITDLVEDKAFIAGFNGLADEEAKSMFMNEQAAMYLIATWDLPNYTTNEDVPEEFRNSVGYFPFPLVNGSGDVDSYVGGPGVGLFVDENSDVKDEAKDFVKFFVEEWGSRAVKDVGIIPATKIDGEELGLHEMYIDVLDDLNNATNITLFADVQMSSAAAEEHLDLIQALFGGDITADEFVEKHEEVLRNN